MMDEDGVVVKEWCYGGPERARWGRRERGHNNGKLVYTLFNAQSRQMPIGGTPAQLVGLPTNPVWMPPAASAWLPAWPVAVNHGRGTPGEAFMME